MLEQRVGGWEGRSHADTWGKSVTEQCSTPRRGVQGVFEEHQGKWSLVRHEVREMGEDGRLWVGS